MRLQDAFDLLERIQASKAKNTIAQTKCILAHLVPFFGPVGLDVFERDYEELWSEYVGQNKGKRKLGHDRRYLVMALKRAQRKEWIRKQFLKSDFPLKESSTPIGRALEPEEIRRLLDEAAKYPRAYLQILLAITMGLRRSEILQLRKDEIDLVNREINLDANRLKTRQPRKVPIPISDQVWPLLERAAKEATGIYIFEGLPGKPQRDHSYHWTKIRWATGIKCRFHDLRHTAISLHLKAGMTMADATKIFGATPEVIARVYHHVSRGESVAFRSRIKLE